MKTYHCAVARRRTLKNNNNKSSSNSSSSSSLGRHAINRHRNRSEPNVRSATSLKNVNSASSGNGTSTNLSQNNSSDQALSTSCVNGISSAEKDSKIDCDVKTLRLYCIHKVRNILFFSIRQFQLNSNKLHCKCETVTILVFSRSTTTRGIGSNY